MAVPHQSFQKCPHRLVCRLLWYLYLPNDPSWCQVDKTQDKQYRRQKLGMMVHTCMLLRKVKRESEVQGEGLEMAQQLKHLLPLQRTQDSFPPLSSGATYPSVPPVWGDPNSLRASMDTACMSYTDTYLGKTQTLFLMKKIKSSRSLAKWSVWGQPEVHETEKGRLRTSSVDGVHSLCIILQDQSVTSTVYMALISIILGGAKVYGYPWLHSLRPAWTTWDHV